MFGPRPGSPPLKPKEINLIDQTKQERPQHQPTQQRDPDTPNPKLNTAPRKVLCFKHKGLCPCLEFKAHTNCVGNALFLEHRKQPEKKKEKKRNKKKEPSKHSFASLRGELCLETLTPRLLNNCSRRGLESRGSAVLR